MKKLRIVSALIVVGTQLSCTTVEDSRGEAALPSARQAAMEAAAQGGGQASNTLAQSDPFALKEATPLRLRLKEDLFQFQSNSENFTSSSKKNVKALGKILASHQQNWERLEIRGHADSKSTNPQRNQELSERRAKAVLDGFIASGLEIERMSSEGFGSSEPLPGKDPTASENRRVELVLFGVNEEGDFLAKLEKFLISN